MARIPAAIISGVFAAIGLTVIVFLWSQPFGQFHSPPLFFRVFGSLVALMFVVMGGTGVIAAISGKGLSPPAHGLRGVLRRPSGETPGSYVCPNCGATLAEKIDVSPSGDVKCPYCKSWFNVHRPPESPHA